MNLKFNAIPLLVTISLLGCHNEDSTISEIQKSLIFQKGQKIENNNFTGTAFLEMLVDADSINQNSVGSVTFEPGSRTNWHRHPNGQIILAIDGEGYYQEKGSPKLILRKGETVKCPPNTPHWHGASASREFVQVAITSRLAGPTEWMQEVTDDEYNAVVK
ncbi:cupin [Echinicola pacifica]|uniref:Cupin n=1 Tax=Echinicola pacifica TaxID=346377 RepID=A0A918PR59_9BACT|nr:cupin domain-containing protein [Echinicola pacifica]GGZ18504.1 cupin [Echinicola pacifica]